MVEISSSGSGEGPGRATAPAYSKSGARWARSVRIGIATGLGFLRDAPLGDEGEKLHPAAAVGAGEDDDLEDRREQVGPWDPVRVELRVDDSDLPSTVARQGVCCEHAPSPVSGAGSSPASGQPTARFVPSAPCATAFREHSCPDREAQARQPQDRLAHLRGLVKEGRLVDRSLAPARRRQVIWRAHGARFASSLA